MIRCFCIHLSNVGSGLFHIDVFRVLFKGIVAVGTITMPMAIDIFLVNSQPFLASRLKIYIIPLLLVATENLSHFLILTCIFQSIEFRPCFHGATRPGCRFHQPCGFVATLKRNAHAIGHSGKFLIPGFVCNGDGVDLDFHSCRFLGFLPPVYLVVDHKILIGIANGMGSSIGNEKNDTSGTFTPRRFLHNPFNHQFIELVTITAMGDLAAPAVTGCGMMH